MAATISAKEVSVLRGRTGAGMMDCKKALMETDGDLEKAVELLRAKGIAKAEKRAGRSASEGVIGSYVHFNGKVAVMVEVNCETDFVARTDDFQQLAKDLAMHIASANPVAVTADDVPEDVVERERAIFDAQVAESGKPEQVRPKIVEGKLKKYFKEIVDDINIGVPIEQALERAREFNCSEKFKLILSELVTSLKTGADIVPSLKEVLSQITSEQVLEIKAYNKKLNAIMMMYLIIAAVMPSLGMTMFTVISGFVSFK